MAAEALLTVVALMLIGWGCAHLIPTRAVVRGFGDLSVDNRRVLTMEWITEGVALVAAGVLVAALTVVDHRGDASRVAYGCIAGELVALAVVSLLTGFRVRFLPYRLCPAIFGGAAALLVLAIALG